MRPAGFSVSEDHPALAGHFPGNPLVPGVVLLDEIIGATQKIFPDRHIEGLREAKFLQPLPPGEYCHLEILSTTGNLVPFKGYHEKELIIQGTLILSEDLAQE